MKKVSVIVPCHNAAKWLPQCFLSLVQQSIGIDGLELKECKIGRAHV